MSTKKKLFLSAAGAGGGATTDVDDVFATNTWIGNAGSQIIDNGIKFSNTHDGGSVRFDGTNTNWVNGPASSDFGFGTGDWTIEFFSIVQQNKNYNTYIDFRTPSGTQSNYMPVIYSDTNGALYYFANDGSTGNRITASGAITIGTWYHIAVSKSGTSTKMFVNGTQVGSTFTDNLTYQTPTATWGIGAASAQTNYEVDGFVSNVRVVKGTALYTSNFTAPTSALTAVTNTKLLTLQGDTPFVDNSSSSHALTLNGRPVASEFGPFTGNEGEGGLVWTKQRTSGSNEHHWLSDTARTAQHTLSTNLTSGQIGQVNNSPTFNSAGYQLYNWIYNNDNNEKYVGWSFRKAPKFFDIVTWTGNGVNGRTISHNLGSTPGMILVKSVATTDGWIVYHRGMDSSSPQNYALFLNGTANRATETYWNNTAPTDTGFTVSSNVKLNGGSGQTYIAYVFAHNNNDGEFGPDADQDIIKCGSYVGNNSTNGPEVNLGFEPQWLFIRHVDANGNSSFILDNMRGVSTGAADPTLSPNANNDEQNTQDMVDFTNTGFKLKRANDNINGNSNNYIYMAIRRGSLAVPEDATKVFHAQSQSNGDTYSVGFPTDLFLLNKTGGSSANTYVGNRLTGNDKYLVTSSSSAEATSSSLWSFDLDNEFDQGASTSAAWIGYHWKRAPSYFDMVLWDGSGSARTLAHSLGVPPEMIWVRRRSSTEDWTLYLQPLGNTKYLQLNSTGTGGTSGIGGGAANLWNNTNPTSSVFSIGTHGRVNTSGQTYLAFLFATAPGVSKVGSYTGNGASTQTIDCGFSSGARFVLLKRTDATDEWYVFDSVRGIVSGNDPFIMINGVSAQVTNQDLIEPHSSGFIINNWANGSGSSWIFYAIA